MSPTRDNTCQAAHTVVIRSTGTYLPERILTNHDLEKMVDTSDEWIQSRTGIRERHIAREDETTSDMAAAAAKQAIEEAGDGFLLALRRNNERQRRLIPFAQGRNRPWVRKLAEVKRTSPVESPIGRNPVAVRHEGCQVVVNAARPCCDSPSVEKQSGSDLRPQKRTGWDDRCSELGGSLPRNAVQSPMHSDPVARRNEVPPTL